MKFNRTTNNSSNGILIGNWHEERCQRVREICPEDTLKRVIVDSQSQDQYSPDSTTYGSHTSQEQAKLMAYMTASSNLGARARQQEEGLRESIKQTMEMSLKHNKENGKMCSTYQMDISKRAEERVVEREEQGDLDLNAFPENFWTEQMRKDRVGLTPSRNALRPFDKRVSNQHYV